MRQVKTLKESVKQILEGIDSSDMKLLRNIVIDVLNKRSIVGKIVREVLGPVTDQGELSALGKSFNRKFKNVYLIDLSDIRGEGYTNEVFLETIDIYDFVDYESDEQISEEFHSLFNKLKRKYNVEDAYPYILFDDMTLKCVLNVPESEITKIVNKILTVLNLDEPGNGYYLDNHELAQFKQSAIEIISEIKLTPYLQLDSKSEQYAKQVDEFIESI